MSVGNNVANYKISATGTASDIDSNFEEVGEIKMLTNGADVHIKIGNGDATTDDFMLQANIEITFPVNAHRVSAITGGSSSTLYIAFIY